MSITRLRKADPTKVINALRYLYTRHGLQAPVAKRVANALATAGGPYAVRDAAELLATIKYAYLFVSGDEKQMLQTLLA